MFHAPRPAADTGGSTPRRGGMIDLTGTIGIAFCHNGSLSASRIVAPIIALELGAGEAEVGALAALFTAIPILATVRVGRWIDSVGTRLPVQITTAMAITATGAMVVLPGVVTLMFTAVVIGAAAAFCHLAITRAVGGDLDIQARTRNFGRLAAGYSACQFAMPVAAGFAYDLWGTRGAFGILLGLTLISLGILLSGRQMLSPRPAPAAADAPRRRLTDLFAVPGLKRLVLLYGLFTLGLVFMALTGPLYGKQIGLSASQIGSLYGVMSLGALGSRLVAAWLSLRVRAHWLMALALILAACASALMPFFTAWAALALVSFGLGGCLGLGQPITTALIYGVAPAGRVNESLGLAMTVTNVLQLATPVTLGLVADAWGIGPMVWSFATLLAVSGVYATRGRH